MAIRLAPSAASAGLALALAAFASGCGSEKKAEAPAPAPAPAPAAAPAPMAPAAPQAAAMPEEAPPTGAMPSGEYPADFPPDVPRYPGSKVTSARGDAEMGFSVTIDAPASVDAVAKYLGDGLTGSGWQTVVQATPDGTMIIAEKGDGRAQALVHEGGTGALVELVVGQPQQE